jgi:HD-GYP domain-containing protein (c-di-GMP phosphodiesterase class II)
MAADKISVNIFDLVTSIARVVDIMSPAIGNHHMQVAYLAFRISEELDLPQLNRYELATAGAMHDIGAFSLQERLDLLGFEDSKPGLHAMAGYLLLKDFKPFASIARIIKFHHVPWEKGKGAKQDGEDVSLDSHIIHLVDRVAVKFVKDKPVLSQVRGICDAIIQSKNDVFVPELVNALEGLSLRDYVWLELASNSIESILRRSVLDQTKELDMNELLDFARLICRLVDFRSEFTATHSSGVAATATALAKRVDFSYDEARLIEIAAYLHDLGKLAIPTEILEKPGKLTDDEWSIMRSHVFYTHQVLDPIEKLAMIKSWGALHQERMNGKGYPFGYKAKELPLGSRIMAVADVFTALTEDRPYRKGMGKHKTLNVLKSMTKKCELDEEIVNIFIDHFDEMNAIRYAAQMKAVQAYKYFLASLK